MKNIIIYSTKYGCTEKAASMLKANMGGETTMVNIIKESVPSIEEYDTVILGGSIYMGKIQKKLTDYMAQNLPSLLKKKTGLFICAGSPEPDGRRKELESSFPQELLGNAAAKEVFGHEIRFEKLNFIEKNIMRMIKGNKEDSGDLSEEKIIIFAKTISC